MKIYHIPKNFNAIIFDLDSTLYTNKEYAKAQTDLPIELLSVLRKKSFEKMKEEILMFQKKWQEEHEGKEISLANTFLHFGINIDDIIFWRTRLFHPEEFLKKDKKLIAALEELGSRAVLSVVTNNPVSIAERTLYVLGVGDMFHTVIGLDTLGVSKPHEESFMRAAIQCGTVPEMCIAVGDRYDIDIALPLELGMGGILVDTVSDVYELPNLLLNGDLNGKIGKA